MEQSVEWYLGMSLDELERHVILKAMNLLHQDINSVARVLGRSHRTIQNKLEQFKTEDEAKLAREHERLRRSQEYSDRARATPPQFRGEFYPDNPPTYDENGKVISGGDVFKPPFETTKKSEMPVHERSEIQEVLSEQTTVLREKRRR